MVVRRRKKHLRFRGGRTYHGSHKKWRGGGSRGGRGAAGMHKHKWSYTVKYDKEHFGKTGFTRPVAVSRKIAAINLDDLEKISAKQNANEIDAAQLGYGKILGRGKISKPLVVKAKQFSKSAIKKLEEAGGKAVII